jgi:hypothetical protein
MKKLLLFVFSCLLFLSLANTSQATWSSGYVLCDANQNGVLDEADTPVQSVLVVVTNLSGTYSNYSWTTAEGFFIVQLAIDVDDTYVETVVPATLPPDSGFLFPLPPVYQFTINSNQEFFAGSFLINNPGCQSGGCWLTGGGTIGNGKKPDHTFGGNVYPGCSPTAGDGGQWTHIAHKAKLQFQGTVVQTVRCGNVAGILPGSSSPITPFNMIEFTGYGSLKGIGGNKAKYDLVYFTARAEDRNEPGSDDRYYLRVFTPEGTTRLLVSGDQSNPTNIVTSEISGGNLQLHVSSCP